MNRIKIAVLIVLSFAVVSLAYAQPPKASVAKSEYTFPDGDACVHFDWEAVGVLNHTLQLTLRGIQKHNGEFLLNGGNDSEFTDNAGLLVSRLEVVGPFDHTEWTGTYLCMPADQFPDGDYDWHPVLTIRDVTTGDLLLVQHFKEPIFYGLTEEPQSTPEATA